MTTPLAEYGLSYGGIENAVNARFGDDLSFVIEGEIYPDAVWRLQGRKILGVNTRI